MGDVVGGEAVRGAGVSAEIGGLSQDSLTPQDIGYLPQGPLMQSVQRAVEQTLATAVPEGKRGALVAVATPDGIDGEVIAKLDHEGNWKLAGSVGTTWGGDISGRVVLVGSW